MRRWLYAAAFALTAAVAIPVAGQLAASASAEVDPPAERVPVTGAEVVVSTVVACEKHELSEVSDRLVNHLRFMKHTGFHDLGESTQTLSVGDGGEFELAEGRRLTVQLLDIDPARARVRVRLVGADDAVVSDTTMTVHRDKTFIVAGPRDGEHGVFILPVSVRY